MHVVANGGLVVSSIPPLSDLIDAFDLPGIVGRENFGFNEEVFDVLVRNGVKSMCRAVLANVIC